MLRILSTWGSTNLVGLTELQLFDRLGNPYQLKPSSFLIRNCGLSSIKTIDHIINQQVYTTDEQNMWVCTLPPPPKCAEIGLNLDGQKGIGALRIWNYNKSLIESTKGIKELEIMLNNQLVWSGMIQKGPGNENEEYVTEIKFISTISLPLLVSHPNIKNDESQKITQMTLGNESVQAESEEKDHPLQTRETSSDKILTSQQSEEVKQENQKSPSKKIISEKNLKQSNSQTQQKEGGNVQVIQPEGSKLLLQEKIRSVDNSENNKPPQSQVQQKSKKDHEGLPESQNKPEVFKIKHHPRINSPFSEFLNESHSDRASRQNDNSPSPYLNPNLKPADDDEEVSEFKKEEKIESIEYFNLTNLGRLKPAKRESLADVLNLKNDIQEMVKNVNKNLDFSKKSNQLPVSEKLFYSKLKRSNLPQVEKKEDSPHPTLDKTNKKENAGDQILKTQKTGEEATSHKKIAGILDKERGENRILEIPLIENKNDLESRFEDEQFIIPELPKGRILTITIYSTWGDMYYVGLCGIEMFDGNGKAIKVKDAQKQIRAEPPDINILPGYGKDPRTVDKLVDGTYLTTDDLHLWLAPYTQGKPNNITIDLGEVHTLSMLRIWNYNKSRAHSFRGARDIVIKLDDIKIFEGEISMAPGSIRDAHNQCEYLMFTANESTIATIEKGDWLNRIIQTENREFETHHLERPMTGDKKVDHGDPIALNKPHPLGTKGIAVIGPDGRPLTSAKNEE